MGRGFERDAVHAAIEQYIGATAKVSLLDVLGAPPWVPRPNRLFTGSAMRETKRLADRAIEARRAEGAKAPPDLLDLLLGGSDPESGRQMTTAELRDNLLTFIVAGHETTALTLSWALYLCAFDPTAQGSARDEAQAVLGDRAATVADLPALPLVRRIVDETLRLYPPAAFLSRTAMAPDLLCGREVRPGDTVILPIYALHRHRMLWEDADAFQPDRFADPKAVPRFQYLPFGDGPRICIGGVIRPAGGGDHPGDIAGTVPVLGGAGQGAEAGHGSDASPRGRGLAEGGADLTPPRSTSSPRRRPCEE